MTCASCEMQARVIAQLRRELEAAQGEARAQRGRAGRLQQHIEDLGVRLDALAAKVDHTNELSESIRLASERRG